MPKTIPLSGGESNANQTLTVQLGNYLVDLELHYQQSGQWLMHVLPNGNHEDLDTHTINDIDYLFSGLMLEPACDIIKSYGVTNIFGQLFIAGLDPTLDNLGVDNKLVWYAPSEALTYS